MTAVPAPTPAPAPEAATPPMALADEVDKIADGFAGDGRKCADAGDQTGARIYSAIATTYRADADRIRERLAPQWDALAARLADTETERDIERAEAKRLRADKSHLEARVTALTQALEREAKRDAG